MSSDRTVVVIPTFNEAQNLGQAVRAIHTFLPEAHVLVVDDASPDGTGELADRLAAEDPRVHALRRMTRDGLGSAYLAGFDWALGAGYTIIGEFDADGSHPASALPVMLAALTAGADVAIGSRWIRGGRVLDWPKHREALSRGGNTYARFMLGIAVRDATAGFRLYRADLLNRMDLSGVTSKGYCFQVDLTVRSITAGGRVVEVPIVFSERALGESKMSRTIVLEAMGMVTVWGLARILGRPGRWVARRAGKPVVVLRSTETARV